MALSFFLIMLLVSFSCNDKKSTDTNLKTHNQDTIYTENNVLKDEIKSVTLTSIFNSISLNEIKKIKTQSTSTFLSQNRTTYYSLPVSEKKGFYGLYFFVNRSNMSKKVPFTAKIVIYGQQQPWEFSDSTESLINLIVYTPEIEIAPFIKIGNSIDSVLSVLGTPLTELKRNENNILCFKHNEIILCLEVKNNKIQTIGIGRYKTSEYSFDEIINDIIIDF